MGDSIEQRQVVQTRKDYLETYDAKVLSTGRKPVGDSAKDYVTSLLKGEDEDSRIMASMLWSEDGTPIEDTELLLKVLDHLCRRDLGLHFIKMFENELWKECLRDTSKRRLALVRSLIKSILVVAENIKEEIPLLYKAMMASTSEKGKFPLSDNFVLYLSGYTPNMAPGSNFGTSTSKQREQLRVSEEIYAKLLGKNTQKNAKVTVTKDQFDKYVKDNCASLNEQPDVLDAVKAAEHAANVLKAKFASGYHDVIYKSGRKLRKELGLPEVPAEGGTGSTDVTILELKVKEYGNDASKPRVLGINGVFSPDCHEALLKHLSKHARWVKSSHKGATYYRLPSRHGKTLMRIGEKHALESCEPLKVDEIQK